MTTTRTVFAILFLCFTASSQSISSKFPDKILGYRLHRADLKVGVRTPDEPRPTGDHDLVLTVHPARFASVGITGARVEVKGEIESLKHEGKIDLVMFRDFTANGMPVDILEFREKFELKRGQPIEFLNPLTVRIGPVALAKAAATGDLRAQSHLQVSGTVLVFGRFKRLGLTFKRVIPLTVAFSIENPLAD